MATRNSSRADGSACIEPKNRKTEHEVVPAPVSQPDLASYLEDIIDELQHLALRQGMDRLGTLLALARDEARAQKAARL